MPGGASTAMRTRRHVVSSTRTVTGANANDFSEPPYQNAHGFSRGDFQSLLRDVRQWSPRNRLEALGRVEWIAEGAQQGQCQAACRETAIMRAFAGLQSCSSATRARLCGLWVVVQAKSLSRKPSTR